MTADTRHVVISRNVTRKTLVVANEFQPNEGMSGADASRRDASAAEASKLTNSDQGRQATPEFTGTTLLEAGSRQRRNEDRPPKATFKMEHLMGKRMPIHQPDTPAKSIKTVMVRALGTTIHPRGEVTLCSTGLQYLRVATPTKHRRIEIPEGITLGRIKIVLVP